MARGGCYPKHPREQGEGGEREGGGGGGGGGAGFLVETKGPILNNLAMIYAMLRQQREERSTSPRGSTPGSAHVPNAPGQARNLWPSFVAMELWAHGAAKAVE